MFEDSDLLQRNMLVLRATSAPDAQFSVLDETGREISRVVAEGGLVEKHPARLVLYDRQHAPVLVVEHFRKHGEAAFRFIDGQGQEIDLGLIRLKHQSGGRRRGFTSYTLRNATKAEVGGFAQALPPDGDHRLGVTLLLTITAEVTSEQRLAALGHVIFMAERLSRSPTWIVKRGAKTGQAWPGSAPTALTR
jgi:hypothetical protein